MNPIFCDKRPDFKAMDQFHRGSLGARGQRNVSTLLITIYCYRLPSRIRHQTVTLLQAKVVKNTLKITSVNV